MYHPRARSCELAPRGAALGSAEVNGALHSSERQGWEEALAGRGPWRQSFIGALFDNATTA